MLCRAVFRAAAEYREMLHMTIQLSSEETDLLAEVTKACHAGIDRALENPSEALGFAEGLQTALATLTLVKNETQKGEAGLRHVIENREQMTREALESVLSNAPDPSAAMTALSRVPQCAPPVAMGAALPPAAAPTLRMPTFGEISQAYIDMRIGLTSEDHKEIKYLILRRRTFLETIGDKPVDQYTHSDMQNYIIAMKTWPARASDREDFAGMSVLEILEANADLHMRPLGRTTMKSYCSHIRTMYRHGLSDYRYKDPFNPSKYRFPATAALPVARSELSSSVVQKAFENGIASGCIDEAMMQPMALLLVRRLGLLTFLRGSDIYERDGMCFAQIGSTQLINGVWKRVPVKTSESVGFFVLHQFLTDIGWTDWAIAQGDNWLFPQAHDGIADPAKYESQLQNRRLKKAGARGQNQEVFHCYRGDGITNLRRVAELNDRTAKLQSGHAFDDVHENYGSKSLLIEECRQIAHRPLPAGLDWSIFRDLDFDAMAAKRRKTGRARKNGDA